MQVQDSIRSMNKRESPPSLKEDLGALKNKEIIRSLAFSRFETIYS
jgi:hypothetical protein